MRKTKQKSNKGFSLVELAIVIAIISILATIGISTWNRYIINSNLREAARAIEADLKFMQRNARAGAFTSEEIAGVLNVYPNVVYTIDFDKPNNKYTMNALPLFQQEKRLDLIVDSKSMTRIDSGPSTLTFAKRGTINPETGTITIVNKKGSRASITYNVTGKIHVSFTNR